MRRTKAYQLEAILTELRGLRDAREQAEIRAAHARADALLVSAVQTLAQGSRWGALADEVVGAWTDVPKLYA